MKTIIKRICIFLLLISLMSSGMTVKASHTDSRNNTPFTKAQCTLYKEQQKLWIDHVSWTHSYIISAIASLKDQDDVLQRLLKNQENIGNSIKSFYGEEAGNKLATLLKEHIVLAGKVLEAAKTNNKTELDQYNKQWYENADQIAEFLSNANPNYSKKELKNMLYTHLQYVTDQVVARLNSDWKADIRAYDKGEAHMIHFADILAEGIIKQFPDKFK